MSLRDKISEVSNSWIGVPFRHHGFTRHGCDCIGLIIGILHECNTISEPELAQFKKIRYGNTQQNYLQNKEMLSLAENFCHIMTGANDINVNNLDNGDILYILTSNGSYHFALFNDNTIIETLQTIGHVVKHNQLDMNKNTIKAKLVPRCL